MKVIYYVKTGQWFFAMPQDDYKMETLTTRDVAIRAIETGWPFERRE